MTRDNIQVSYIVPAFRADDSLMACVDSIRCQDFSGAIEILIVDNGENSILRSLQLDAHTRIIKEKRRGASFARNAGLAQAKGKFIAFIDADIVLKRNWTTECVKALEPVWMDCVQSPTYPTSTKPKSSMAQFRKKWISAKTNGTFCYLGAAVKELPILNSSAFLLKAKSVRQHQLTFDTKLKRCEDTDFTFQLLFRGCHFRLVTTTSATVSDNRSHLGYLKRSFNNGIYTAQIRSRWMGRRTLNLKGHWKQFMQFKDNKLFVAHILAGLTGELVTLSKFNQQGNSKIHTYARPDIRNPFFLKIQSAAGIYGLSSAARLIQLEKELVIMDLRDLSKIVFTGANKKLVIEMLTASSNDLRPLRIDGKSKAKALVKELLAKNLLEQIEGARA
jgi:glycosyltransferase involved in cell wall biosynthesis